METTKISNTVLQPFGTKNRLMSNWMNQINGQQVTAKSTSVKDIFMKGIDNIN